MRGNIRFLIVTIIFTTSIWLTACERPLSDAEQTAVLAFSEPIMDNLFAGLAAGDYATFARDFDQDMQEAIPQADFASWRCGVDCQFGSYLSRQVDRVTQSDEFYIVVYQVAFEQEKPVIIGVALHAAEPHSISHLWLNSETSRRK